jgi:hypothetical protein
MPMTHNKSFKAVFLAILLLYASIILILSGCGFKTIKGSGNVVSETRQVPEFDQIRLEGQGKVFLTGGANQSLVIKTDDNILPHIDTTVRNRKLVISHENVLLSPTNLSFLITLKDLKGTSIAGSGDIKGNSRFVSDIFYAEISGSGSIDLELETIQLESEISGSGSINLAGLTDHHRARITGSGKIHAVDMQAKSASVSITGSGDCFLTASDQLKAKITGSGDVLYKGRPRIDKTITGSGEVRRLK